MGIKRVPAGSDFSSTKIDTLTGSIQGFNTANLKGLYLMTDDANIDSAVSTVPDISGRGNNLSLYGSFGSCTQKSYGLLSTDRYGVAFEMPFALPESHTIIGCVTPETSAADAVDLGSALFPTIFGSTTGIATTKSSTHDSDPFITLGIRSYNNGAASRAQVFSAQDELNGSASLDENGYGQAEDGAWLIALTIDKTAGTATLLCYDGETLSATSADITTRYGTLTGNIALGCWYRGTTVPEADRSVVNKLHGFAVYDEALTAANTQAALNAMKAIMDARTGVSVMTV